MSDQREKRPESDDDAKPVSRGFLREVLAGLIPVIHEAAKVSIGKSIVNTESEFVELVALIERRVANLETKTSRKRRQS